MNTVPLEMICKVPALTGPSSTRLPDPGFRVTRPVVKMPMPAGVSVPPAISIDGSASFAPVCALL